MLSILIPVYNYNILSLVEKLNEELVKENFSYEIICVDDASENKEVQQANSTVKGSQNCYYEINKVNLGRSKIRNLLVEKAKYNKLLFLDCDVLPATGNFVKTYLDNLDKSMVVFGGLKYPQPIENLKTLLHYNYGTHREVKSFNDRKNRLKDSFSSASFAIRKEVFEKIKFDENIKTYGFEDLVFAKQLIENGHEILQIDNPIIHFGIETDNAKFINKEQESLKTLKTLNEKGILKEEDVTLLKFYSRIKPLGLRKLYDLFYRSSRRLLLKNLKSKKPSLLVFDLYRLGYFNSLKN